MYHGPLPDDWLITGWPKPATVQPVISSDIPQVACRTMIYIENTMLRTEKSVIYLGNAG
jgi:hypothetical protein